MYSVPWAQTLGKLLNLEKEQNHAIVPPYKSYEVLVNPGVRSGRLGWGFGAWEGLGGRGYIWEKYEMLLHQNLTKMWKMWTISRM